VTSPSRWHLQSTISTDAGCDTPPRDQSGGSDGGRFGSLGALTRQSGRFCPYVFLRPRRSHETDPKLSTSEGSPAQLYSRAIQIVGRGVHLHLRTAQACVVRTHVIYVYQGLGGGAKSAASLYYTMVSMRQHFLPAPLTRTRPRRRAVAPRPRAAAINPVGEIRPTKPFLSPTGKARR
jgi:hypothetical protein